MDWLDVDFRGNVIVGGGDGRDRGSTISGLEKNITIQVFSAASPLEYKWDELARFGLLLCHAAAYAQEHRKHLDWDPAKIFLLTSGGLRLHLLEPDDNASPTPATLGIVQNLRLLTARQAPGPTLTRLLEQAESQSITLGELRHRLQAAGRSRKSRAVTLAAVVLALLLAGIEVVVPPPSPSANAAAVSPDVVEQLSADAEAARVGWESFFYAHDLPPPPQMLDADEAMRRAKRLLEVDQEGAARAYREAVLHYRGALSASQEMEARRAEAGKLRVSVELAQQPWLPIIHSSIVQAPPSIFESYDARNTGDLRYLTHRYEEARFAYELADRLMKSVPEQRLAELTRQHAAGTARRDALDAHRNWQRLQQAAALPSSQRVLDASRAIAGADAMYQAGRYDQAARSYEKARQSMVKALEEAVEKIVKLQDTGDAHERAAGSILALRSAVAPMGQDKDSVVLDAQALFDSAVAKAGEGGFDEAQALYEQAEQLAKNRLEELENEAAARVGELLRRMSHVVLILEKQEQELGQRTAKAQRVVDQLQQQLGHAEQSQATLDAFAQASAERLRLSKLSRFCVSYVFSESGLKNTESVMVRGQELYEQGKPLAAVLLLGTASENLDSLARHYPEADQYLLQEAKTLALADATPGKLGPLARSSAKVKADFESAQAMIERSQQLFRQGDLDGAKSLVGDAGVYLDGIVGSARESLQAIAEVADAELRFDDAEAALIELLNLAPNDAKAKRHLDHIRTHREEPQHRVTLRNGQLFIKGRRLSQRPELDDIEDILGKPSRVLRSSSAWVYDQTGVMVIPDADQKTVRSILIYYGTRQNHFEPEKPLPGFVQINGNDVARDATPKSLNTALGEDAFEVDERAPAISRAKFGTLGVRLNTDNATKKIYNIAIDY